MYVLSEVINFTLQTTKQQAIRPPPFQNYEERIRKKNYGLVNLLFSLNMLEKKQQPCTNKIYLPSS